MDFSANSCPLSIDNTVAPGTELQCWNTGPFNQITIDITGIDAAEYDVVVDPGGSIIDTITADGTFTFTVVNNSRLCLVMKTSGTGTATVNAYLTDANISILVTPQCLPFFLFDGTLFNIAIVSSELPFFLFDGSPNNIPVVPC